MDRYCIFPPKGCENTILEVVSLSAELAEKMAGRLGTGVLV